MRIIHRDMTQNELRDIQKIESGLALKIQKGEIQREDLDETTIVEGCAV